MIPAPLQVSRSSRTTQSQIIERARRYSHTHGTGRFDGVNELLSEVRGSVLHLIASAKLDSTPELLHLEQQAHAARWTVAEPMPGGTQDSQMDMYIDAVVQMIPESRCSALHLPDHFSPRN